MDNNTTQIANQDDVSVIDIKDMILAICQKWRVLISLGVVGLILGMAFGAYQFNKEPEFDTDELNLKGIEQYARYQQMYNRQLEWENESVLLNIDPDEAYSGSIQYLLRVNSNDSMIVSGLYSKILNNETRAELAQASGLNCTVRAMQELASIGYSELDRDSLPELVYTSAGGEATQQSDTEMLLTARVTLSATAPSQEICEKLLEQLDSYVAEMNAYVVANYSVTIEEQIITPASVGSSTAITDAKKKSTETLASYANTLTSLEKNLSDDDLLYYAQNYPTDEEPEEGSLAVAMVKWALIIGVLLGALGVCWYGVIYLLDTHIKTSDDLLAYGLHPLAVLEEKSEKKKNALDRLFATKHNYNSVEYLAQELAGLGLGRVIICGDMQDEQISAVAQKAAALDSTFTPAMRMGADAGTQQLVREAGGVVLLVHLRQTVRADLEQEIRICKKIKGNIIGVVMIG